MKSLDEWKRPLSFSFRQFKYSEGIVCDEDGVEYGFAAAILGNRYLCAAYAWLTEGETWYEVFRNDKLKVSVDGADVSSRDGKISFTGGIEAGRQVSAEGEDTKFNLHLKPLVESDLYGLNLGKINFGGYLSLYCKVTGTLTLQGKTKNVKGIGNNEYFSGFFGRHASWKYFSVHRNDFSIYASNARFNGFQYNKFILRGGNTIEYEPETVQVNSIDNRWIASAKKKDGYFKAELHLLKARPSNLTQPYIKVKIGPWKIMELTWKEYLINVKGHFAEKGEKTEFGSKGIAEEMDAIW